MAWYLVKAQGQLYTSGRTVLTMDTRIFHPNVAYRIFREYGA